MLYEIAHAEKVLYNLLSQNGIENDDAVHVVASLLDAELRELPEHGTIRIHQLLQGIRNGTIRKKRSIKVLSSNQSIYCVDAQNSIGCGIACDVLDQTVANSMISGVAVGSIINSSHLGCLYYYVKRAVINDCIVIAFTTSAPTVCLKGSGTKVFGTNPIAYAIPSRTYPIIADFSTSVVSRGKVLDLIKTNKQLPDGLIVDKDGNASNDPSDFLNDGALLPFSNNHKASLIAFIISVLAGPMIGGVNNFLVQGTRTMSAFPNKGDFFIVLHVPHFSDMNSFLNKIDELKVFIQSIHSDFYIPNSRSYEIYNQNLSSGKVNISDDIINTYAIERSYV